MTLSPAVERLLLWCEAFASEGDCPDKWRADLLDLVHAVRQEDPLAAAFDRARDAFRRMEKPLEGKR